MNEETKVETLADLVAYQDRSVVSKALMKKDSGNVTLFAFDREQGLSEHTAPFDAMVCVLDGIAEVTVGGVPKVVRQGEMLIMPANVPHALKAVERFKMMLVMLKS